MIRAPKSLTIFAIVLLAGATNFASAQKLYEVTGTFTDFHGRALPGLQLHTDLEKVPSASTDANGRFELSLAVGDHTLTVEPSELYGYRAFLKIRASGPNPDNVVFKIDPSRVCCATSKGEPFPKLINAPKPAYPPAAAATGKSGEVIVDVSIKPDGKVDEVIVLSGHPFLQASARAAARSATFEPSDVQLREARLTYLFIRSPEDIKPGIPRYLPPYTVEIIGHPDLIQSDPVY